MDLPIDIITAVLLFSDIHTVGNIGRCCRKYQVILTEQFWRRYLLFHTGIIQDLPMEDVKYEIAMNSRRMMKFSSGILSKDGSILLKKSLMVPSVEKIFPTMALDKMGRVHGVIHLRDRIKLIRIEQPSSSKVVDILNVNPNFPHMVALCDDGTLYGYKDDIWRQVDEHVKKIYQCTGSMNLYILSTSGKMYYCYFNGDTILNSKALPSHLNNASMLIPYEENIHPYRGNCIALTSDGRLATINGIINGIAQVLFIGIATQEAYIYVKSGGDIHLLVNKKFHYSLPDPEEEIWVRELDYHDWYLGNVPDIQDVSWSKNMTMIRTSKGELYVVGAEVELILIRERGVRFLGFTEFKIRKIENIGEATWMDPRSSSVLSLN